MLESIITSKTRIKLLVKFFLNPDRKDYLRNIESDLGDNINGIRVELCKMEEAGLLKSTVTGNKKFYFSNKEHPLFQGIHGIIKKVTGIEDLINQVLSNVGDLNYVYLTGKLAQGNDSEVIDLIVIGDINKTYFQNLALKTERYINKKIRFAFFSLSEYQLKAETIISIDDLLIFENVNK